MTFIETVPPDEATGLVAEQYEVDRAARGHVPNFTQAFSLRPGVYAAWRQLNDANSVWFVPEGGYGQYNGQVIYTHGASFGVLTSASLFGTSFGPVFGGLIAGRSIRAVFLVGAFGLALLALVVRRVMVERQPHVESPPASET